MLNSSVCETGWCIQGEGMELRISHYELLLFQVTDPTFPHTI